MPNYFGKYRGKVVDTNDPLQLARVRASVPELFGEDDTSWALPCLPYAGPGVGWLAIPPIGASVWVEFERGDLDHPIWSGCFWHCRDELPNGPPSAETKVLQTDTMTMKVNDLPGAGSITIETTFGARIAISATGIEIANGMGASISLQGSQVLVNDCALEAMTPGFVLPRD